jgi:hypothetical protein
MQTPFAKSILENRNINMNDQRPVDIDGRFFEGTGKQIR